MKLDSLKQYTEGYRRIVRGMSPLREWILGIGMSLLFLVIGMAYAGNQFFHAYSDGVVEADAPVSNVTYKAKEVSTLLEQLRKASENTASFEAGIVPVAPPPVATSTLKASVEVAPTGPLQVE